MSLNIPLKIATAQFNAIAGNFGHNLKEIVNLLEQAAKENVRIVLFPELSVSGYDLYLVEEGRCSLNEKGDGLSYLLKACQRLNIFAVVGACIERSEGISNSAFVINDKGEIIGIYNKHFLDSSEKELFLLGEHGFLFEVDGWTLSLAISYDSYYSEHAKTMALSGAQVYLILGAFIKAGYNKIDSNYFSERALENQIYIVISNFIGEHSGMTFSGNSSIYAPDGVLLVSGYQESGISIGLLEKSKLLNNQDTIPVSADDIIIELIGE